MFTKTLAIFLLMTVHGFAQEKMGDTPFGNDDFKIRNKVFVGQNELPSSTNLTLFQRGLVLDFRYSNSGNQLSEITIFDVKDRSFVLLDVNRKLRLKIDNLQLVRVLDGMRKELKESPKVNYLLFEDVTEEFDAQNNLIKVTSDRIRYEVAGIRPSKDQTLAKYLQFLENYTLLGVSDPSRLPPFARIRLNLAIKKFGLMPSSVSLTILDADGVNTRLTATSNHELETELSDSDRQLVNMARKHWVAFRQVGLAEYRSIEVSDLQNQTVTVEK